MSANVLEHPHRTRMPVQDEPYTEQVVLLEGQGVWYFTPISAKEEVLRSNFSVPGWEVSEAAFTRKEFGLKDEWFVFFCPQSVFKIHPLYDEVIRDILLADPSAHVVLTGGRKDSWTDIYERRLRNVMNKSNIKDINSEYSSGDKLSDRLHIISRVSSERFLQLLSIADVMLHPFPFDGSRTSADALIKHIPYVTLPTEYLRGRMGAAFLQTMNIPELVARDRDDYVRICLELLRNRPFYTSIKQKIGERVHLIWEDMEYAHSWTNFLLKISVPDQAPMSWESFISSTGRSSSVEEETKLRNERRSNMALFRQSYGSEDWLLEDGVANLESTLFPETHDGINSSSTNSETDQSENYTHIYGDVSIPRIFNNWRSDITN